MRVAMRITRTLVACVIGTALTTPALADTLREALANAYKTNPTLTAERANQRAVDENVPIARAAGLPTVGSSAGYNENVIRGSNSFASPGRVLNAQVALTVPIFSGGAVRNSVRAARTRVEAERYNLRGTESDLFTAVVGAYMDVIRDEAIVALNQQNVHVLDVNLQASRDRFQVGDLTRTDVAQSEARLSLARAQLDTAEANLISSREQYVRLVGSAPGVLETPPALPNLPTSPDGAVDVALKENPQLLAAQRTRDATAYDVSVAKSARLPRISVSAGPDYNNYLGSLGASSGQSTGQSALSGAIGLGLSLPLFQAGLPAAQVRQAQARRGQAIEQATAAERDVIAQARAAYAVWRSSQAVIRSSQEAVDANKLSLQGVRAENSVGNRTILDILNAEQELLNSQVTLVTAQRDAYVAGFALLASMGQAEAADLGLDGGSLYDPVAHYDAVSHRLSDYADGSPAQPVATRTIETPAQTATVTRPLDPSLDTPVDTDAPLTSGAHAPNR